MQSISTGHDFVHVEAPAQVLARGGAGEPPPTFVDLAKSGAPSRAAAVHRLDLVFGLALLRGVRARRDPGNPHLRRQQSIDLLERLLLGESSESARYIATGRAISTISYGAGRCLERICRAQQTSAGLRPRGDGRSRRQGPCLRQGARRAGTRRTPRAAGWSASNGPISCWPSGSPRRVRRRAAPHRRPESRGDGQAARSVHAHHREPAPPRRSRSSTSPAERSCSRRSCVTSPRGTAPPPSRRELSSRRAPPSPEQ